MWVGVDGGGGGGGIIRIDKQLPSSPRLFIYVCTINSEYESCCWTLSC